MKTWSMVVAFVLFSFVPQFAIGQETKIAAENTETRIPFTIERFVDRVLFNIEDSFDWLAGTSLAFWSDRELLQRCGRYWVDAYGDLIAPDNREIGIWGIDDPYENQIPRRY